VAALAAVTGALALAAAVGVTRFEVYDRTRSIPVSKEARDNQYLALERWLGATGRKVRSKSAGTPRDVAACKEKAVLIHASRFDWQGAFEILVPWAASGGILAVSLDEPALLENGDPEDRGDRELAAFLESLGVRRGSRDGEDDTPEDFTPRSVWDQNPAGFRVIPVSGTLDSKTDFKVRPAHVPADSVTLRLDSEGRIKVVTLGIGHGSVTVMGIPYFMRSTSLYTEENALLAWDILGVPTKSGDGVLFIGGKKRVKHFWGKLTSRGNAVPLAVSCAVLLIVGFWSVIPVFGFLLDEPAEAGKSIRERFRSEARFLRKHRALWSYIAVYREEIRRQEAGRDAGAVETREEEEKEKEEAYAPRGAGAFLKEVRRLSESANRSAGQARRDT
jgi:hypothetical protein